MNLGYLSPSGKMYICSSYGHMELAMRICNTYENPEYELKNSLDCETYLLDIGYVCIRSRSVVYEHFTTRDFSKHFNAKVCVNILTDAQKNFLKQLFKNDEWYNTDQMDMAQQILEYDAMLKNSDLGDGEILNPLNIGG